MSHRVALSDLALREYWTPAQCARVLGRGSQWWVAAYDDGAVEGYRDGVRETRYLRAESARGYLEALGAGQRVKRSVQLSAETRATLADFRARQRAALRGTQTNIA